MMHNIEDTERVQHMLGMFVGSVIMAVGALIVARVFLTATWGRWTWQIVGLAAAVLSLVLMMV